MPHVKPMLGYWVGEQCFSCNDNDRNHYFGIPKEVTWSEEIFDDKYFLSATRQDEGLIDCDDAIQKINATFFLTSHDLVKRYVPGQLIVRGNAADSRVFIAKEEALLNLPFVFKTETQEQPPSGIVSSCLFEDFNTDGLIDLSFQTHEWLGNAEIRRKYVMYQLDYYGALSRSVNLPDEYGEFLNRASTFKRHSNMLNALIDIAHAVEAGHFASPEEKRELLNSISCFFLDKLIRKFIKKSEDDGWLDVYVDCLEKIISFDKPQRSLVFDRLIKLVSEYLETRFKNKNPSKTILTILNSVAPLIRDIDKEWSLYAAMDMLRYFLHSDNVTTECFTSFSESVYQLATVLSSEELAMIYGEMRKKYYYIPEEDGCEIANEFRDAIKNKASSQYFSSIYELLTGEGDVPNSGLIERYGFLLGDPNPPSYEDIVYADKNLGLMATRKLALSFNLTHFGRYSKSVLDHLFEMSLNVNHKRELPLIFAIVAKADTNGAFDWGKHFDYDPNTRMVVVEVSSVAELVRANEWLVESYGVPDSIFFTAHGRRRSMLLGAPFETIDVCQEDDLKREMSDIYTNGRPRQVVLNSCSVGASAGDDDSEISLSCDSSLNMAQTMANIFNADTYAPEGKILTPILRIEVENGFARMIPYFIEFGGSYGLNIGGTLFVPSN